ncbi:AAA domain containing protein [uncultured Caudovirales phage]|uniref:AAA domain containing protein n=1 Tax=uncultured Caudovirales phage TaxID=2100421 RepID=A0A6J5N9F0_9CAUD|nr:AAA domain containing protein [uncultured Caudovirales phage]
MAFDLSSIKKGKSIHAPRIFLYSTHGIGKSTFAANAPDPIFICTEDGLGSIDTASFPLAKRGADVMEAIRTLYTQQHDYKTVVLDSADWLENLLVKEIEDSHDAKELAYGKAALLLADKWREVLDGLNALRNDKNMVVILIGHCEIKRFDSPEVEPYDRYQPKLQSRASALLQEWADAVLFANYRTIVKKDDVGFNKSVSRGITTGERLLYTSETPAYLAKNRYNLPAQLPLDWNAFAGALAASAV